MENGNRNLETGIGNLGPGTTNRLSPRWIFTYYIPSFRSLIEEAGKGEPDPRLPTII